MQWRVSLPRPHGEISLSQSFKYKNRKVLRPRGLSGNNRDRVPAGMRARAETCRNRLRLPGGQIETVGLVQVDSASVYDHDR